MKERKTCPACHSAPVAVNCYKNGKVYYRDRCDKCIRSGRKARSPIPAWVRSGYKKKPHCEKCGFVFKLPGQASVVHVDGNIENANWANLKTICANCSVEVQHGSMGWVISQPLKADV